MKKAFTMVELLIVMVVGAILSAIAVSKIHTSDLNDAARQLVNDIRYTQYLALNNDSYLSDNTRKPGSTKDVYTSMKNGFNEFEETPKYTETEYYLKYWTLGIITNKRKDEGKYYACTKREISGDRNPSGYPLNFACQNMPVTMYAVDYLDKTKRIDGDDRFDLKKKYGVDNFISKTPNGYFQVYFDEFGAPYYQQGGSFHLIKSNYGVRLEKSGDFVCVFIEPITGRAYIDKECK